LLLLSTLGEFGSYTSSRYLLIYFVLSAVKTEEGNAAARFFGFPEAFTTVQESVDGVVAKVRKLLIMIDIYL
jgi:hypothetical protein